ncbi:MAG TPA: hypothetical protein HA254_03670 [Candidatus Diapherotrites archaeon]|uniref:Uncharacterized protein n=1 Tax=Candidatus Iainarchaeum sp. TaxID=3101447 RepID=A0A7J4IY15_9ARCH|nr:hypothetical protein [Candidatus Diapherotrites archaeon]
MKKKYARVLRRHRQKMPGKGARIGGQKFADRMFVGRQRSNYLWRRFKNFARRRFPKSFDNPVFAICKDVPMLKGKEGLLLDARFESGGPIDGARRIIADLKVLGNEANSPANKFWFDGLYPGKFWRYNN